MNPTIDYRWIDTNQALLSACEQAAGKPAIALDTEFVRTRSFYPKLGLVQLFDGEQVSLIDFDVISEPQPFIDLLANRNVVKVLHAASEDLEVFQHRFNQLPEPLVDTQIVAAFLGLGQSVGFASLVQRYLDVVLDKGASRTDWLARPLSEAQKQYAACDVWYLLPIYQQMQQALANFAWREAVLEECQNLLLKRSQPIRFDKLYKEISNAWRLEPQQLAVLQLLTRWRYEEAEKRDLALNFVVKEANLWQIAQTMPKHTSALLEFMHPNEVRIHGKKLLWLVEQGRNLPAEQYPEKIRRLVDEAGYKLALKSLQEGLEACKPADLPAELIASKRQLNQLFSWVKKGQDPQKLPELLTGWRTPFGEKLQQILQQLNEKNSAKSTD